jgi:PHP domain
VDQRKFLKSDLHIHTTYSDGVFSLPQVVDFYGQRGFDAIAITDHLCESKNVIGRFSHTFGMSLTAEIFPDYMVAIKKEAVRAIEQYGMLVLPGYEITKNSIDNHRSAHVLVLGTTEWIDPNQEINDILEQARNFNAFTIAAHPFHTGDFEFQSFYLWSRRAELSSLIDAWEINSRMKISPEVMKSGLRLIANSDFHVPKNYRAWKTKIFSEKNQNSLFQAIREQKVDFFLDREYNLA